MKKDKEYDQGREERVQESKKRGTTQGPGRNEKTQVGRKRRSAAQATTMTKAPESRSVVGTLRFESKKEKHISFNFQIDFGMRGYGVTVYKISK